jgi:hypothetical protein
VAEKKQYLAKALLHQSAHEKSQKEVNDFSQQRLPFLLPHEWLSDYLHQPGAWAEAMPEEGTFYARKLAQACDFWSLASSRSFWRWSAGARENEPKYCGPLGT